MTFCLPLSLKPCTRRYFTRHFSCNVYTSFLSASSTLPSKPKTSPRYENLVTFFIASSFSVNSLSSSALPVKSTHFLLTKSLALLRHSYILECFLCTQVLHLVYRIELVPTLLLHSEDENFEVTIDTIHQHKKPICFFHNYFLNFGKGLS